ncbi:MAG: DNA polymerase III subunit epsilon [Alphaproteobacteria bacterium]|nr:DNA polymerase III subunit epsilon [Alphaproteobacteria bacterium]
MREIVLDTETTGLDPFQGHRLVEIGCIELHNHLPTGRVYHQYINPERDMPLEAFNVHGLAADFLKNYPVFSTVADAFLEFIDGARLIIHNARFDLKFLNFELAQINKKLIEADTVLDTLLMAREKFPGSPANLDALCRRFNVDNTGREKHGALLDSELLAAVYLELIGGRQHTLSLEEEEQAERLQAYMDPILGRNKRPVRPLRSFPVTAEEEDQHKQLLGKINDPFWGRS